MSASGSITIWAGIVCSDSQQLSRISGPGCRLNTQQLELLLGPSPSQPDFPVQP